MKKTTCFACHASNDQSKGPPYSLVAQKYHKDPDARNRLAAKVISGGAGSWGAYPMPPHPQHTPEQARSMVDWILSLAASHETPPTPGTEGAFTTMPRPGGGRDHGIYVVSAAYTDQGAPGASPLASKAVHVLHARRKRAAFADARTGMEVVHELTGKDPLAEGMVARFSPGDSVRFDGINLSGIDRVSFLLGSPEGDKGAFEIHADSPTGPLLARAEIPAATYRVVTVPIKDPGGVHNLYVVAHGDTAKSTKTLNLIWLEFHDSPAAAAARSKKNAEAARRIDAARATFKARPFVRDWSMADFLTGLEEPPRGRSFERGRTLFQTASCISCHRMGKEGGTLGPDLSEAAKKRAKDPAPRAALLREILEPSKFIDSKFQTVIITTDDGLQKAGILAAEDAKTVHLIVDPALKNEKLSIPRDRIESITKSNVSLMPTGLLSTFTREEILDLLAYIESAANPNHPSFQAKSPAK